MNPLHKHKIMSNGCQVKQNLKSGNVENLKSRLKFWVWESGRKIDPATGVGPVLRGGWQFSSVSVVLSKWGLKQPRPSPRICVFIFRQTTHRYKFVFRQYFLNCMLVMNYMYT